jgi:hypothetical protein
MSRQSGTHRSRRALPGRIPSALAERVGPAFRLSARACFMITRRSASGAVPLASRRHTAHERLWRCWERRQERHPRGHSTWQHDIARTLGVPRAPRTEVQAPAHECALLNVFGPATVSEVCAGPESPCWFAGRLGSSPGIGEQESSRRDRRRSRPCLLPGPRIPLAPRPGYACSPVLD